MIKRMPIVNEKPTTELGIVLMAMLEKLNEIIDEMNRKEKLSGVAFDFFNAVSGGKTN